MLPQIEPKMIAGLPLCFRAVVLGLCCISGFGFVFWGVVRARGLGTPYGQEVKHEPGLNLLLRRH